MRKRLLLTGATGFVGRALLPRLAEEYEVTCLARARTGTGQGHPRLCGDRALPLQDGVGVEVVEADLSRPGFARGLPGRAEVLLHLAVAPPSLAPEPAAAFQVNAASQVELLEWARTAGVERLVFTSSGSVYGPQAEPIGEKVPPQPTDQLGVAKVAAEMVAGLYAAHFAVVVLRVWRPYGPGQPGNLLIPRLAARIEGGEPIQVNRGGHPRENTIYIDELVEVVRRALRFDGTATLNVAHSQAPSILELCQELEAILGRPAVYQALDREAGDRVADVRQLEEVLGFRAQIAPAEGLRRTWGQASQSDGDG